MSYYNPDDIEIIHLNNKEGGLSLLTGYLGLLDSSFDPLLSSYIDINSYAQKLITNAYVAVLEYNGNFVGLYAVYLNDKNTKTAYLTSIAVLDEYKGCGFSNLLLEDALNRAKLENMSAFKLEVMSAYMRAIRFYKKYGFVKAEEQTTGSDTFYMIKELK